MRWGAEGLFIPLRSQPVTWAGPARGFSPRANDHAGDAQQLQPVPGHQPPPQVPVHALHGQVETQAREVLHGRDLHQPVNEDVPVGTVLPLNTRQSLRRAPNLTGSCLLLPEPPRGPVSSSPNLHGVLSPAPRTSTGSCLLLPEPPRGPEHQAEPLRAPNLVGSCLPLPEPPRGPVSQSRPAIHPEGRVVTSGVTGLCQQPSKVVGAPPILTWFLGGRWAHTCGPCPPPPGGPLALDKLGPSLIKGQSGSALETGDRSQVKGYYPGNLSPP